MFGLVREHDIKFPLWREGILAMGYSMKSREVIARLERDGWVRVRAKGDHFIFRKEGVDHLVTVTHPRKDFPAGTLRAIFRQAGWNWPPAR